MNPTNVSVLTETIVSHSVLSNTMEFPIYGESYPVEFGLGVATTFSNVQLFSVNTGGYFSRSVERPYIVSLFDYGWFK